MLRWFHAIGLPVVEGYGSTEVTFSATANRPGATRIGTVGPPMPGVSVRIDPAGEILVRGDTTCAGYWQDEDATARLFDEGGWLHTGDLGYLDDDGYLSVTGRKDDLVITSYGQNVSPEAIEMRLRMDPLIAQAVVIGDGRPFLTALLVLDPATAADRTAAAGGASNGEALAEDPTLLHELGGIVERVNRDQLHAEAIRRWRVLPRPLTIADGELTPTLKVRRRAVANEYARFIDEMYR